MLRLSRRTSQPVSKIPFTDSKPAANSPEDASSDTCLDDTAVELMSEDDAEVVSRAAVLSGSGHEDDWEEVANPQAASLQGSSCGDGQGRAVGDWVDLREGRQADAVSPVRPQQAATPASSNPAAAIKDLQNSIKGELDAVKAAHATLQEQLQEEAAGKRQLAEKLSSMEQARQQLEGRIAALLETNTALEAKVASLATTSQPGAALVSLGQQPKFSCKACKCDIGAVKHIMWNDCRMGKHNEMGALFKAGGTVNTARHGPVSISKLATGEYEVADVHCCGCNTSLGWRYLTALQEKNKFKEDCTILYKRLLQAEAS